MTPWIFIALAVAANVACNIMLKKAMSGLAGAAGLDLAKQALASPWFWGGAVSGGVLLLSYLLAIRTLDLSVSYAVVTSAALIGITLCAMLFLGEAATAPKLLGVALVIAGIILISRSQGA